WLFLFFFSSRRRHTRSKRDWSSDVCSSDLVVDLLHLAVAEGALQVGICPLARGDDHHPGGANVEPLDDALALRGPGGRDTETGGRQARSHGGALPTQGWVCSDTDGLIHGDDVVVGIENVHALDELRWLGSQVAFRGGKGDVQPLAGN